MISSLGLRTKLPLYTFSLSIPNLTHHATEIMHLSEIFFFLIQHDWIVSTMLQCIISRNLLENMFTIPWNTDSHLTLEKLSKEL